MASLSVALWLLTIAGRLAITLLLPITALLLVARVGEVEAPLTCLLVDEYTPTFTLVVFRVPAWWKRWMILLALRLAIALRRIMRHDDQSSRSWRLSRSSLVLVLVESHKGARSNARLWRIKKM